MGRRRKLLPSFVQGIVRQGVREGLTNAEIAERIDDRYTSQRRGQLRDVISQERTRDAQVTNIMSRNRGQAINLGRELGCTDESKRVRAYITIDFVDERTGARQNKGTVVELDKRGRISEILDKGIQQAREFWISRNYAPPTIRSKDRTGTNSYRVEYFECV